VTTLVLGATGFIGSAVIRQLATGEHGPVIGFVRTPQAAKKLQAAGIEVAVGDLNDTESLCRAMSQVDTVISCASYVGSDEQRCLEVNHYGMRNVTMTGEKLGIRRLVYVGTAAVYGPGPFRDLPVDGVPLRPRSPASRTRAIAEQYVRDVGGLVIRPHLVTGHHDRWFMPTLLSITSRLGALIESGRALHSTVSVEDLASSLCTLSKETQFRSGATLHVNNPVPQTIQQILTQHAGHSGAVPDVSLSLVDARRRAAELRISDRHVQLISTDHWFKSHLV
jgi:2-alkyl-3-oxoalkanoate reductase